MKPIRKFFHLPFFRRTDVVRDVDDEIAFHIAMREHRLRASGTPTNEAEQLARARFGDVAAIREQCLDESERLARRERVAMWLEELKRDVIVSLRALRRAKAFTAAVVVTLALGIGANTTMFSIVGAVILHPIAGLPHPETLFEVGDGVAYPEYRDLARTASGIPLGALSERRIALGTGAAAEHVTGAIVSGNWFGVVGIRPALGRVINVRDDVAGAAPVTVLTHSYWTRALGGDSSIIGRTVTVNGAPVTVVGVAARDFRGLHLGVGPAVWLPIHAWPLIAPSSQRTLDIESRNWGWLRLVGRVPEGTTADGVQTQLARGMSALDPGVPPAVIADRARPRFAQAVALPRGARDAVVGFVSVLTAVVVLVLLSACANITGLMLSRAAYREREIGVRMALGAGPGRLVRQLLTESIVLASFGGMAGIALFAALRAVLARTRLPGGIDGSAIALAVDTRLVVFAIVVTAVTGVLVGLVPALQAARADALSSLKGGRIRGARQQRLRGTLVTAQVAIALVLLVGTGLFTRALSKAFAIDLGFRPEPLVTLSMDPGLTQFDAARSVAYFTSVLNRVSNLPGVRGATFTANTPLTNDRDRESATIAGYVPPPGERVMLERNAVGPRYHEIMGIPMVAGRGFDERDNAGRAPVVIINETAAKRYFAGRSAIDAYLTIDGTAFQIVGVARDAKYHELTESPSPYMYLPLLQGKGGAGSPTLVVRVAGDASRAIQSVAAAVRYVNPVVPVFGETTMEQRLRVILAPQLVGAWLLGAFGALALIVASVGIYGIVAYAVSQRTREIGVRMALGARAGSVLALVVRSEAAFIALGLPIGVVLSLLLGRAIGRFLFGVGTADPLTFAGMSLVMVVVGLVASLVPARRATQVDPLIALRGDE
jgi:predicted permease